MRQAWLLFPKNGFWREIWPRVASQIPNGGYLNGIPGEKSGWLEFKKPFSNTGAGMGIRTPDLLITNQGK